MKRAFLVALALLISGGAPAEEMKAPHISVATVDWDAAAASLPDRPAGSSAETFAKLNMAAEVVFPNIANSTVPVLLPYDTDGLVKELAADPAQPPDKTAQSAARFMRSGFQATKFFLTGPAGYNFGILAGARRRSGSFGHSLRGASLRPVFGLRHDLPA